VKIDSNGKYVNREKNLIAKRIGNNLHIGNEIYRRVKNEKLRSEFLK